MEIAVYLVVCTAHRAEARDAQREPCSSPFMWEDGKLWGLVSLLKWPVLWFSLGGPGLKFYKWTAGRWDLSLLEYLAAIEVQSASY